MKLEEMLTKDLVMLAKRQMDSARKAKEEMDEYTKLAQQTIRVWLDRNDKEDNSCLTD